jgi:hypothetical protein
MPLRYRITAAQVFAGKHSRNISTLPETKAHPSLTFQLFNL